MKDPANNDAVQAALGKAMPEARLDRIPRHPERRDIVLAVISCKLQRRYPYTEPELKDVLGDALASLNSVVDHVTCRRYLVDCGFVKRDRAGTRYYLNFPKLEATLDAGVMENVDTLVQVAITPRRKPRNPPEDRLRDSSG